MIEAGPCDAMTPFEMAIVLMRAGVPTPPYPTPLSESAQFDSSVLLAAYIHLCDAWEFHITCLYEARMGAGTR
ncbi:hypothetical protein DBA29_27490 [Xenophilus aerolatus]|uniref:Uncharacterized protein n=1 Tax=Variovorax paradoxus TaxID=34073 RepID=A0A2W5QDI7_VARPD|nr:hypothetical protein [Xenophilus aerolatus]PZQ76521.1 MAG: hypothetical protein DI563_06860 [Variovorax paradoxus]